MANETIRVTMEADSAQLQAEFKKARQSANDFAQRTLPLVERELNQAFLAQQKLNGALRRGGQDMKTAGTGLLQLAYFADDVQYGVRGILNNIPGLVMGFGAGAGLAGAISMATLAAAALWPHLQKIYGDGELKKLDEVNKAFSDRLATELERINEMERELELAREIDGYRSQWAAAAQNELRVQNQRLAMLEAEAKAVRARRQAEDELRAARAGLESASAAGAGGGAAGETVRQDAAVRAAEEARRAEIQRLQEDILRNRELAKVANQEYDRILTSRKNLEEANAAALAAAEAEAARLRRSLAAAEANVDRAEAERKETGAATTYNLIQSTKRRDEIRAELKRQEAAAKMLKEQDEAARARADQELATLSQKAAGAREEEEAAERMLKLRREVQGLERGREDVQRAMAIAKAADDEAAANKRDAEAEERKTKARERRERQEQAKAAEVARNRQEFAAELKVLELRARGQTAAATALEKEARLRREAVALAKSLGIEEGKALELLRRRERMAEAAERGALRPRGSRIGGDRPGSGLRRVRVEAARGLGRSVAERVAAERGMPDTSAAAAAARFYERSLANEEAMIAIFRRLGVA